MTKFYLKFNIIYTLPCPQMNEPKYTSPSIKGDEKTIKGLYWNDTFLCGSHLFSHYFLIKIFVTYFAHSFVNIIVFNIRFVENLLVLLWEELEYLSFIHSLWWDKIQQERAIDLRRWLIFERRDKIVGRKSWKRQCMTIMAMKMTIVMSEIILLRWIVLVTSVFLCCSSLNL